MSRYTISPLARDDLDAIWEYIGIEKNAPRATDRLIRGLFSKFATLAGQPLLGELRPDLGAGLRSFTAGNYVVLYRPSNSGIEIAAIVHTSRDIVALLHRDPR